MENTKKAQFRVIQSGPIEVSGEFVITGPDGKIIETSGPVYLCRCGASGNKPFCDGSHHRVGFNK
jgi:CDGSH-type Zn-finger protein